MSEQQIRLKDIPDEVMLKLKEIAVREQKYLYDVYRDALVNYAETHK